MRLAIVGCGVVLAAVLAQAAEPTLTIEQQQGKVLFEATCVYCHNPRGWATERLRTRLGEDRAVLADRTDLSRDYVRTVVRNGFMTMPAYTPTDLDEAQIKAIAAYLTRRTTRPEGS